MPDKIISLEELSKDKLKHRSDEIMYAIISRGRFGDVMIVQFNSPAPVVQRNSPAPELINLVVTAEPLDVAEKLINDLEFDNDVTESAVIMVLDKGLNWVREWKEDNSAKLEIFDLVNELREISGSRINQHQHHFAGLPMQKLIQNLNRSIDSEIREDFRSSLLELKASPEIQHPHIGPVSG